MKKILAIFLLAIFLFNYMGYFIASKVALKEAKREMRFALRAGIIDEKLTVLITIPKKEMASVLFVDEGKEIIYKGELYDIINRTESKNAVTFKCINDKNEEQLLSNLEDHITSYVGTPASPKSSNGKKIGQNLVKLYYSEPMIIQFAFVSPITIKTPFLTNFISEYLEISSPPPRLG